MGLYGHPAMYSYRRFRGRNNCWQTIFKFGTDIPFFNRLDKLVGQKSPLISTPLERVVGRRDIPIILFWESSGVLLGTILT